jgi:hypothetical protein
MTTTKLDSHCFRTYVDAPSKAHQYRDRIELGWEFRFLVPISGTPIVNRILIPFLVLGIPVGILLNSAVEN